MKGDLHSTRKEFTSDAFPVVRGFSKSTSSGVFREVRIFEMSCFASNSDGGLISVEVRLTSTSGE